MEYPLGPHGHAPEPVRKALLAFLAGDSDEQPDGTVAVAGERRPLDWLYARLWNCTDQIPADFIDAEYAGMTYADAVRMKSVEEIILDVLDTYHGIDDPEGPAFDDPAEEHCYPFSRILEMLPFDHGKPPDHKVAEAAQRIITEANAARAN